MKDKYRFNIKFIIEILIYEVININESIKNKKFENINKEISEKKRFLI